MERKGGGPWPISRAREAVFFAFANAGSRTGPPRALAGVPYVQCEVIPQHYTKGLSHRDASPSVARQDSDTNQACPMGGLLIHKLVSKEKLL